jgi:hypothetical protein
MRVFQLASQTRLVVSNPREREKAILEVTREQGTIPQVFDRFSLSVQDSLYSLDDRIAVGQEELEKLDMGLEPMQSHASISVSEPAATTRR